jgi:hypothetical protein
MPNTPLGVMIDRLYDLRASCSYPRVPLAWA